MENLNKVVKEIKIVAKPAKRGGKNYFVRVELVNGRSADVWCDKEVVELIHSRVLRSNAAQAKRRARNISPSFSKCSTTTNTFTFCPAQRIPLSNCSLQRRRRTKRQRPQRKVKLWQTPKSPQGIKAHTQKPQSARPFSLWFQSLKA